LVAAGSTHQVPSRAFRVHPALKEGQTMIHGATSLVHKTPDGRCHGLPLRLSPDY
jgi:hypothetical protein